MLQSGVLVRVYRDSVSPRPAAAVHQIVAPVVLRPRLLQIAHEIPAAAHLGIAKTSAQLQRHFYWPGITTDVKEFCRICDVCQQLAQASHQQGVSHQTPQFLKPRNSIANPGLHNFCYHLCIVK